MSSLAERADRGYLLYGESPLEEGSALESVRSRRNRQPPSPVAVDQAAVLEDQDPDLGAWHLESGRFTS